MKYTPSCGLIASSFRSLPPFELMRPSSVAEAVSALTSAERPAVLAGGTDLPARFNEGFAPSRLVDISRIEPLRQIVSEAGTLSIGAMVTHAEGANHPVIAQLLPTFGAAWSRIANVRVRMSATLGGNVMAGRARYEGLILLTAMGASLVFATPSGERIVALDGQRQLPSAQDGLLTGVRIPLQRSMRVDYERSLRPILTQAVAVDADGNGRVVTATEHVAPRVETLERWRPAGGQLASQAFGDPVTSDTYLNQVRAVLFDRQIARLGAA